MATASEVGSVLEGLQQLEGLAHRHLGISSDMGTSLLSQSVKHQQAFALTSPCVAVYVRCTHSRGFWSCATAVRSEVLLRRRCVILFNVCCMYSRRQVRDVVASYVKRKNRVAHAPAALHQLVRSSCNRPGMGPHAVTPLECRCLLMCSSYPGRSAAHRPNCPMYRQALLSAGSALSGASAAFGKSDLKLKRSSSQRAKHRRLRSLRCFHVLQCSASHQTASVRGVGPMP